MYKNGSRVGNWSYIIIPGLLLFVAISILNFWVYRLELGSLRNIYNNEVVGIKSVISRRFQSALIAVESTRAFFVSSQEVTKEEFNFFSSVLEKSVVAGAIAMPITIEWIDAANKIQFVYPMNEDNTKIIGLDLNQYPNRLSSIIKAKATQLPVVTEPIMLRQGYPGLLIYSPIYKGSTYLGEAVVVVRLANLLAPISGSNLLYTKDAYIRTGDFIAPFDADVILNNNGGRIVNPQGDFVKDSLAQKYLEVDRGAVQEDIVFADKTWQLRTNPSYLTEVNERAVIYATISIAFLFAMISFLWLLQKHRKQAFLEQEKAEKFSGELQKFKLAVDNASDQIVITDPEGIVIYGNKAVEKITGYRAEEAIGKKAASLWKVPMNHEYYENFWKTIKIDKKEFVGEITNIKKNGTKYNAVIGVSPVLDSNRNVIYFVGIERDVTKERELDKAKDEFISLASHQLRTPITAISWNSEMLLSGDQGLLNQDQKTVLEGIHESSKNMEELIGGFLDITKIEGSGFIVEKGDVDLVQIANSLLSELANQISYKKINIVKKYGSNVLHLAIGTKTARIILQNLLTNAIKYTPEKGTVEIAIERIGAEISIFVKDSGYGIPNEAKSRIFTKLFRADNIKEKEPTGTGLGLYLLKSLVDKLGGKVWFDSKEGVGTTFFVNLKNFNKD
ncbi:MAG: ATP-binding protein [Candidatus Paceibacterota bacterium]|jgi:PAS domain S-box-containing protein